MLTLWWPGSKERAHSPKKKALASTPIRLLIHYGLTHCEVRALRIQSPPEGLSSGHWGTGDGACTHDSNPSSFPLNIAPPRLTGVLLGVPSSCRPDSHLDDWSTSYLCCEIQNHGSRLTFPSLQLASAQHRKKPRLL